MSMVRGMYGSDCINKITFDPPPPRLVGRPNHWCIREYLKLDEIISNYGRFGVKLI